MNPAALKKLIRDLISRRFIWFLLGIGTVPILSFATSVIHPTPKSAMGFVGFYEENMAIYTFLGDHTYSLKFPGDRQKFESVAQKLGLHSHKVSENEYREEDQKGQGSRRLFFDETDKLHRIQFYSSSS